MKRDTSTPMTKQSTHQSENVYDPPVSELLSVSQTTKITGWTRQHISLLMRDNKLWGIRIGRNWFTTKQSIDDYLALEIKPGPKPRS